MIEIRKTGSLRFFFSYKFIFGLFSFDHVQPFLVKNSPDDILQVFLFKICRQVQVFQCLLQEKDPIGLLSCTPQNVFGLWTALKCEKCPDRYFQVIIVFRVQFVKVSKAAYRHRPDWHKPSFDRDDDLFKKQLGVMIFLQISFQLIYLLGSEILVDRALFLQRIPISRIVVLYKFIIGSQRFGAVLTKPIESYLISAPIIVDS